MTVEIDGTAYDAITFDCYGTLIRFRMADMARDMFADRLRAWIVRGHGQTAVVVADWLRARTDRGRECGLDKATASRPDNGEDISRINRDFFADIRTLKRQGVRRPISNPPA
jgi:FMN phosphatase YigB (HAD superfamily)